MRCYTDEIILKALCLNMFEVELVWLSPQKVVARTEGRSLGAPALILSDLISSGRHNGELSLACLFPRVLARDVI